MSLKVLVVGKDQISLLESIHRLKEYNLHLVLGCSSFAEAIRLLENTGFDIVFIDTDVIFTHVSWGVKIIHEKFKDIKIILISSTVDYLDLAFDTHITGYILKPLCDRNILNSIERAVKFKLTAGFQSLMVKEKDREIFLSYKDIIFIEASNRKCIIHTLKQEYSINKSIKDIVKELPSDTFVQSHRSFIINIKKVKYIEQFNKTSYNVVFSKERIALMSRKHLKELKSMISS